MIHSLFCISLRLKDGDEEYNIEEMLETEDLVSDGSTDERKAN